MYQAPAAGLCIRIHSYRRQAHLVAFLKPIFGIHALAVDAHFTLA